MKRLLFAAGLLFGLAPLSAQALAYTYELLSRPVYKQAMDVIFKAQPSEAWVRRFLAAGDGVTTPGRLIQVSGENFELYDVCEPHNCAGNFVYFLFTPNGQRAFAVSTRDGQILRFYGNPSPALKAVLSTTASQ